MRYRVYIVNLEHLCSVIIEKTIHINANSLIKANLKVQEYGYQTQLDS